MSLEITTRPTSKQVLKHFLIVNSDKSMYGESLKVFKEILAAAA
jgi:hypothetical protein